MAHDGKVIIDILGDASDFTEKLQGLASKGVKALTAGVTAATAAITAAAGAAAKLGMEYETATAKLQTISGAEHIGELSADILSLSNATGEAAADLADVAYNAISAGVAVDDAVGMAETATKLATAGFTDTSSALSVLTTALNSYGDAAGTAEEISDSLIQVQNLGVTTVAELSANMGKAIATGSAYGVSLGNLESAYVSITKAGINTAEGTTYLNSMMNELGDTGSDIAKIIKKQTGKSFSDLMGEGKSLADVLGIVYEALGEDSTAMMNLWGSAEAGKAANAIINQGLETFNENLEAITDSAGTTESAYETMTRTLSFQTDRLKTRIKNLGITIYDYFSESLVDGVSSVSDAFEELGQRITTGDLADEMQEIGDSISELIATGAELAADVLPAVIDGLAWILDHASGVVGIVAGIGGAMLSYTAMTKGAAAATAALNAVMNLNPAVLLASALAGLTIGVIAYAATAEDAADSSAVLVKKANELKEAAEADAAEIDGLIDAYHALQNEINDTEQSNSKLTSRLIDLTDAYDGSASSAREIQSIVESLNSRIPGLNLAFDEQTGALNKTSDAMAALNEMYAAQERFDAGLEHRSEMENRLSEAKDKVAAAQNALNEAQERYNNYINNTENSITHYADAENLLNAVNAASDALETEKASLRTVSKEYFATTQGLTQYSEELNSATENAEKFTDEEEESTDSIEDQADATKEATKATAKIALKAQDAVKSGENLADTYDTLSGELETLSGAGDPYIESLAEQALMELDASAKAQELYAAYGEMSDSIGISTAEISGFLASAGMSFEEFQTEAGNCTGSVINSFQAADTSLDMSIQDMINNLADNIAATAAWNDNITELWNAAVASGQAGATEFVQQLYEMGPSAAAQVAQMVTDVDGTLAAFAPLFADAAQEGTEQAAIGVAMASGSLIAAGEEIAGELAGSIADADTSTSGQTAGENAATGLSDTADSAASAAETVAESAIDTFDSYANQFSASGKNAATKIANAFTSGSAGFSAMARTRANDIKNAFTTVGWNSLGFNISSGIAAGLSNGSYLITRAATRAAQAALSAAKSTLGVHSPSRVFRDEVGKMIPPGIGEGVEDAMPELETDVRSELSGLTKKATAAVRTDQSRVNSAAVRHTGSSASNAPARRMPDQHVELAIKGRTLAKAIAHDVGGYMEWEVL